MLNMAQREWKKRDQGDVKDAKRRAKISLEDGGARITCQMFWFSCLCFFKCPDSQGLCYLFLFPSSLSHLHPSPFALRGERAAFWGEVWLFCVPVVCPYMSVICGRVLFLLLFGVCTGWRASGRLKRVKTNIRCLLLALPRALVLRRQIYYRCLLNRAASKSPTLSCWPGSPVCLATK